MKHQGVNISLMFQVEYLKNDLNEIYTGLYTDFIIAFFGPYLTDV